MVRPNHPIARRRAALHAAQELKIAEAKAIAEAVVEEVVEEEVEKPTKTSKFFKKRAGEKK